MPEAVCGIILAGGNATRMGREKTLLDLAGKPVLAHVIARFAPQVSHLALNANDDAARFAAFGLPVFGDATAPGTARQGPVAGLLAALAYARAQNFALLATVPGDAPFLPRHLVAQLRNGLLARHMLCLAARQGQQEPLFGLWRCAAQEAVAAALASGERALHRVAAMLPANAVAFDSPADADSFCNLNTPQDLVRAEILAQAGSDT